MDAIDAERADGEEMYLQRLAHTYILRMYGNGFLKNGFVVYTREYSRYIVWIVVASRLAILSLGVLLMLSYVSSVAVTCFWKKMQQE